MVRGAKINLKLRLLGADGQPLSEEIVNGMELDLYTSTRRDVIAASVEVGSGIVKESQGVYHIEISEVDTLKLDVSGTAYLEGWLLPVHKKIAINLGKVVDNIKND